LRECSDCKWCELITNSNSEYIWLCVDTESGAYMEETGPCGSCDLEPLEESEELEGQIWNVKNVNIIQIHY
jgi:hypothetical protein